VAGFIGSPAMNFVDGKLIREDGLQFVFEEHRIPLPQGLSDTLDKVVDKPVTLGIRPEDIHDKASQKDIEQSVEFRMTAEVIEPMGNENYMYLAIGQSQLVARVPSTVEAKVGSECEMIFDLSKIHLFDGETEKALII
jgi:multiple sugar transport system ATP-binding protein